MKAPLYSTQGKKIGEVVLNPEIYGAPINERLLALVEKAYAANLRHGTASTKTRKEVRGGGRKPWRQKGTGRARTGSIRAPHWRGGGTIFGPHPRSYNVALSKTIREKAIVSALSKKADQKNLVLLEELSLESPKTKECAEIFKSLPMQDKRILCVVKNLDEKLKRASQNLNKWVRIRLVKDVNAYHILHREKLVIEQNALPDLEKRLQAAGTVKGKEAQS